VDGLSITLGASHRRQSPTEAEALFRCALAARGLRGRSVSGSDWWLERVGTNVRAPLGLVCGAVILRHGVIEPGQIGVFRSHCRGLSLVQVGNNLLPAQGPGDLNSPGSSPVPVSLGAVVSKGSLAELGVTASCSFVSQPPLRRAEGADSGVCGGLSPAFKSAERAPTPPGREDFAKVERPTGRSKKG
jgi:hypothetical protein